MRDMILNCDIAMRIYDSDAIKTLENQMVELENRWSRPDINPESTFRRIEKDTNAHYFVT